MKFNFSIETRCSLAASDKNFSFFFYRQKITRKLLSQVQDEILMGMKEKKEVGIKFSYHAKLWRLPCTYSPYFLSTSRPHYARNLWIASRYYTFLFVYLIFHSTLSHRKIVTDFGFSKQLKWYFVKFCCFFSLAFGFHSLQLNTQYTIL